MKIDRLTALIEEYQSRGQEAVALFTTHKNINPINWRQNDLPRIGFIDPEKKVKYVFHGIGCCVHPPSGQVDWDFGYGERHDGFDIWRLWNFAEEGTKNFQEFADEQIIKATFADAVAKGLVSQRHIQHHDSLYYFTEQTL
ncbi:MAG TPA: hypothetical protein VF719_01620 [Abditibacteriaceae bacterium]|jgi:hypothetical protein